MGELSSPFLSVETKCNAGQKERELSLTKGRVFCPMGQFSWYLSKPKTLHLHSR